MMKRRPRSILSIFTLYMLLLALSGCSQEAAAGPEAAAYSVEQAQVPEDADSLNVYFFDVGQGDCTILTLGEHAMIVDAGENDKGTAVQSYLNYLGIDSLDYAVLTHPDSDHIGGMDVVLYKFDCDTILMPDKETDTRTYDDVIQAMKAKDETAVHPEPGDTFSFGDASFTVLSPLKEYSDNNNNSLVLRLTHGENTFLFTGDAEEPAEEAMLDKWDNLSADVLKLGHHGSNTATSADFLDAVSPEYAVVSCGEDNKYGHPHAETLNKLRERRITVYRTDEQGTIIASSDGKTITWDESPSESWQTGEPSGSAAAPKKASTSYILNTSSKKFHLPDCESVEKISKQNRKKSSESRDALIEQGYEPCGRCNP